MKCKELWYKYLNHFKVKVAFDIIFSCKFCALLALVTYMVAMYVSIIPTDATETIFGRVVLSIVAGVGATVITAPLFLIAIIFLGISIRVAKDCCRGGCNLCTWFRKHIGAK